MNERIRNITNIKQKWKIIYMLFFHFITFCKGSLEDKMLEGVNEYREQNKKPPLQQNQKLNEAAQ